MSEYMNNVLQEDLWRPSTLQSNPHLAALKLVSPFGTETFDKKWVVKETKIRKRSVISPKIELFNISFSVRSDGESVLIESEQWASLCSSGRNFEEAVSQMIGLLRNTIREYVMESEENLSDDAKDFRNFLVARLF